MASNVLRRFYSLSVRGPEAGDGDYGSGWKTIYEGTTTLGEVSEAARRYASVGPDRTARVFEWRSARSAGGRLVFETGATVPGEVPAAQVRVIP